MSDSERLRLRPGEGIRVCPWMGKILFGVVEGLGVGGVAKRVVWEAVMTSMEVKYS